jgi:hypothetical protein
VSAKIMSIRNHFEFSRNYRDKWDSRIAEWRAADIEHAGGWLRGNKYNTRPHLHPSNVALNRWYRDLKRAYLLKARIDLITHSIKNPHF